MAGRFRGLHGALVLVSISTRATGHRSNKLARALASARAYEIAPGDRVVAVIVVLPIQKYVGSLMQTNASHLLLLLLLLLLIV